MKWVAAGILALWLVGFVADGALSRGQLTALALSAGCTRPVVAGATAMAESSGRIRAVGDSGNSIGPWQIHIPSHPRYTRGWLMNPWNNARAACSIAASGRGWENWTTYRTGTYRTWMP